MRFMLRRLALYALTLWAAITINFFIPRMLPGDPVKALLNRAQGRISSEARDSLYVLFGLNSNRNLFQQYLDYLARLLHGDLGTSFAFLPTPVSEVIRQSLPWTIGLVGLATIVSFTLGTAGGVLIGWRRGSWADALLPITSFFAAVPVLLARPDRDHALRRHLAHLPAAGSYDAGLTAGLHWDFVWSVLRHGTLPALTIVISSVAGWMLGMRNMMVTVGAEDYVTVAHAKGLSERRVMLGYAARNAVLPQLSGFALALGFIVRHARHGDGLLVPGHRLRAVPGGQRP